MTTVNFNIFNNYLKTKRSLLKILVLLNYPLFNSVVGNQLVF
jgi:hypothetical protein